MIAQERIDASVTRIGAGNIVKIVPVVAADIEGVAQSGGEGILISQAEIGSMDDRKLDAIIAHEIFHQAFGPKGQQIKPLIAEMNLEPGLGSALRMESPEKDVLTQFMRMALTPIELPQNQLEGKTYFSRESWDKVTQILKDAEADRGRP